MKRAPYSQTIREQYVEENLENSTIVEYDEVEAKGLQKIFYDDLEKTDIDGFPFASDLADKKGNTVTYEQYIELSEEEQKKYKLRFHYLPKHHELYIGTTGSGKTTGCIEPQLRAISRQKNKPNIFLTDPKGELFQRNAKYLVEQGYDVQILNFKDFSKTHRWNPLLEAYDTQMEMKAIGEGYKIIKIKKKKADDDGVMFSRTAAQALGEDEDNEDVTIEYNGMKFASVKEFNDYIEPQKYLVHGRVSSMVNQLCTQMIPDTRANDPVWTLGARALLNGIISSMLEEAIKENTTFTREMMNLMTINDIFAMFRVGCQAEYDGRSSDPTVKKMRAYLKDKSKETIDKIEISTRTANATRQGFFSTFQSQVANWMQAHIFQITSGTTISLEDKGKPFAIFVVTRDYDKSDNIIAGLFVNWVYRNMLERAEKAGTNIEQGVASTRDMHFLLDEFANIPQIPDFEIKIATARSRNIWFHLFIQSYDQLDKTYLPDTAKIIVDNCNQQTFLGSQSTPTKQRFSVECGKKSVTSLHGVVNGASEDLREVPVVSVSALDLIAPGEMYIKRLNFPVIKSRFVRSYQCAKIGVFKDFFDNDAFQKYAPVNSESPANMKYRFAAVIPDQFLKGGKTLDLSDFSFDDDDD